MNLLNMVLISGLAIFTMVTLLWLISLRSKDASIIDIFWGLGFVICAWVLFLLSPEGSSERRWLIAILVSVWGLRLSVHIARRNLGKGEDFRYRKWRQEHGQHWWWRSYLQVFLLQGVLMWLIASPIVAVMSLSARLSWLDALGVFVWLVGFYFEAMGDRQLAQFKAQTANKGKLLTTGLWSLTRHPNYFGDAAQWWGFYLLAMATGGGVWTAFSPILMSLLLRYVSGVDLLEKSLAKTKPEFVEYAKRTNAFIPWFPKSS